MKKILLVAGLAICGIFTAQKFELTPNNFVNSDDKAKDFVVIEVSGKTQKQLFEETKMFIQSNFKNLKGDGYNEVEYSQIKLRARSIIGTGRKMLGIESTVPFTNVYEIGFKDGKVMIKPYFEEAEKQDKYDTKIYLTGGSGVLGRSIFKKDNTVWMEELYKGVQDNTNDFVSKLTEALKSEKSDW
ncbi:hypothetical protein [Kaistella sp.]|uniref:hypothetical protein n=1 Tax=Kaistella sp. TaxID=2782235 RepID=UPI003C320B1D